jgi:hypothetical protein
MTALGTISRPLMAALAVALEQQLPPRGEWSGRAGWVRFARSIPCGAAAPLGGPSAGAAFGGNLSRSWLARSVIHARTRAS